MLDPVYFPIKLFKPLATTLAATLQGNYTAILEELGFSSLPGVCETPVRPKYTWVDFAQRAVRCGDAQDLSSRDLGYWKDYIDRCERNSPELGQVWADLGCAGWHIRPRERFPGPFVSPPANATGIDGHPSAPILFLSSRYDPVTPLSSAHFAAKGYPGSVVAEVDGFGHCTLLASPSACRNKVLGTYMDTGILPEKGTVCKTECFPWKDCKEDLPHYS